MKRFQSQDSATDDYWSRPCSANAKLGLMLILVTCFIIQSCLVYFDPTDAEPLALEAITGKRLWHRHNCQSCHQLYGFGGFLGPDLTNVMDRATPERIEQLLTFGSAQMPAFNLPSREIAAIGAFLSSMNETGRGQATFGGDGPATRLIRAIENTLAHEENEAAARGYALFTSRGCLGCHIEHNHGFVIAPDLMDVCDRLERAEIMDVIEHGRIPKMLAPHLSPQGREQTYAFLVWLGQQRPALLDASAESVDSEPIDWLAAPWWEFK